MTASQIPAGVLVVDDERSIRTTLRVCLERLGCAVDAAATAGAARDAVARTPYDIVFLDLRLGDEDGSTLIPELLALQPALSIVVITAFASYATAVQALRAGAVDFLPKPFTPDQVRLAVEQASGRRRERVRITRLEEELSAAVPEVELSSRSPAMREALDVVARAAPSEVPVLLRGESGTGKGVLARALHAQSPRREAPFVAVNCPLLTGELLASELFGHVRGAFTGADRDRPGRVEAAAGGTLFLDEVAELPPALQAKLLRFLQDHEFERLGETRVRTADVRVVAATNADLEQAVAEGRFREDLLYRLNVIEVSVPPLRDRLEDLPRLAASFLAFAARQARRPPPQLLPEALHALVRYGWPGNVRELRNVMERAVILWPAADVGLAALPARIAGATPARPALGGDFTLEQVEREHLEAVLARSATLEEAARTLGIDASTLWRKRKRLGM